MGYYSSIDGSINGISEESYKLLWQDLSDNFDDYEFELIRDTGFGEVWISSYSKHRDIEEIFKKIADQIAPGFFGELSYTGEEGPDMSTIFFKSGEWEEHPVEIIYPKNPFKPETTKTGETL